MWHHIMFAPWSVQGQNGRLVRAARLQDCFLEYFAMLDCYFLFVCLLMIWLSFTSKILANMNLCSVCVNDSKLKEVKSVSGTDIYFVANPFAVCTHSALTKFWPSLAIELLLETTSFFSTYLPSSSLATTQNCPCNCDVTSCFQSWCNNNQGLSIHLVI